MCCIFVLSCNFSWNHFEEPGKWLLRIKVTCKVGFRVNSGNAYLSTKRHKISRPDVQKDNSWNLYLQKWKVCSEFVTQNVHNDSAWMWHCWNCPTDPPDDIISPRKSSKLTVYFILNFSHPKRQCCRFSFKEIASLFRFLLFRFSELNCCVVPWSSI